MVAQHPTVTCAAKNALHYCKYWKHVQLITMRLEACWPRYYATHQACRHNEGADPMAAQQVLHPPSRRLLQPLICGMCPRITTKL